MKKYSKEERLEIGKEVYNKEIKINQAAIKYNINPYTVRDYMGGICPFLCNAEIERSTQIMENRITISICDEEYTFVAEEKLIEELIKAKVEIERAKKGYQVLGGGHKIKYETIN